MTASETILTNLQSSAAALVITFVAGFVAGRLYNRIPDAKLDMARSLAGAVMVALSLLTVLQLAVTSSENRRAAECQARDRDEYRAGLAARATAATGASDAEIANAADNIVFLSQLGDYLDAVTRPGSTIEERRSLTRALRGPISARAESDRKKIAAQQATKKARADNPVTSDLNCDPPK